MSALDVALARADAGDAEAQAFYEEFLNTLLYVPTTEPEPNALTVSLLVADIEGEGIVPVFDSEARLGAWAERDDMPFTVLAGHTLVERLDRELLIALNPGTEHYKLFVEDELGWLRERLAEAG